MDDTPKAVELHYTKKRHEIRAEQPAGYRVSLLRAIRYKLSAISFRLSSTINYYSSPIPISPMFDVILYQPEIPPNTGNIIRLCANTGVRLHLVKPLGFSLEDKQLVRAGLDYHEFASISVYENWAECASRFQARRMFAVSTKSTQRYDLARYEQDDAFLFGPETRGLPTELIHSVAESQRIRVPMLPSSRSLNLSNTVAVVIYEAWRQVGFVNGR
jgi:tRNA (cytidine/uridine-2'-O-)-methyltransferase